MRHTFLTLAILVTLGLVAAGGSGLVSWSTQGAAHRQEGTYFLHFNLGLFVSIGTLLAHCLIFTYFLGTGRWVKEVGLAYQLPDEPLPRLTRELKRRTFPPALAAMLVTIAAAASGAGVQLQGWPWPVHAICAVGALLVNLWAFRIEIRDLHINVGVIDQVMCEVDRLRQEHGLAANAEALEQDRQR
jgi:hypothetical protein